MDIIYKQLQEHLDKMPIGYPATASGVELRLLEFLFTPEQARIALNLNHKYQTMDQICEAAKDLKIPRGDLEKKLEEMVDRGSIVRKEQNGVRMYAALPFAVGMLEFQHTRSTAAFREDTGIYFEQGFGAEMLGSKIPQTRIIPIGKSIPAGHRIGTYDELRDIIEKVEGHIRVGKCACRAAMREAGHPCRITRRDDTCMAFREYADVFGRTGWGREISKEEALEIAARNEEDGLVLQPGNQQEVQFMCSCCSDCCGIFRVIKSTPRPAEFVASNFYAQSDPDQCLGCGTCVGRCQMEAISLQGNMAKIDLGRCIGCGLCVPTCSSESMHLVQKKHVTVPPKNLEQMYEVLEGSN